MGAEGNDSAEPKGQGGKPAAEPTDWEAKEKSVPADLLTYRHEQLTKYRILCCSHSRLLPQGLRNSQTAK